MRNQVNSGIKAFITPCVHMQCQMLDVYAFTRILDDTSSILFIFRMNKVVELYDHIMRMKRYASRKLKQKRMTT